MKRMLAVIHKVSRAPTLHPLLGELTMAVFTKTRPWEGEFTLRSGWESQAVSVLMAVVFVLTAMR